MSKSLETLLLQAKRDLEQERAWIDRCGGSLSGYRQNYQSDTDPQYADKIYAADRAMLQKAKERVAHLEERLNASRPAPSPASHTISYRSECSCGWEGGAYTDITAARRDGYEHDKASGLVAALMIAHPGLLGRTHECQTCARRGHRHVVGGIPEGEDKAAQDCVAMGCRCAGQCNDCERPVDYSDEAHYQHTVNPERGCHLIPPLVENGRGVK